MANLSASRDQCPLDLAGGFMMLPHKDQVEAQIPPTISIDDGIFNHPVVILSKRPIDGLVAVLVVTSFNETPIRQRHKNPKVRRYCLPVFPADHPDTNDVLTIAHRKRLQKLSYVKTNNVYQLPLSILHLYWGDNDLHLEGESYRTLAGAVWQQNLATHSARLLLSHGMEPPLECPDYPAIESTFGRAESLQTPRSVPRSLPISSYGTFSSSSRSDPADFNAWPPRYTVAPSSNTDRRPNEYSHYHAHGSGPRRPTWSERWMRITASRDIQRYAIKIVFIIFTLALCWFVVNWIRSVIQAGLALGRDVFKWFTKLPSTIGGAITHWIEGLKSRLGRSLTAIWTA